MFDPVTLGAALGLGLLVGLERERKKGDGPGRGVAGVRTFAATALLGYVAMLLGQTTLVAVVFLGLAVLLTTTYVVSRNDDPGITTEVAQLLVLLLGAVCLREPGGAVAIAVILTVLLAYRSLLHGLARQYLSETELRDGLILASAALVILPLVPDRYVGPFQAINFRTLWRLTVLMLAVSAAGQLAVRLLGRRHGLALAGFASGFVSSTATVAAMGALARRQPASLRGACASALLSAVATPLQMGLMLAAVSPAAFAAVRWPLLACAATSLLAALPFLRRHASPDDETTTAPGTAFSLHAALLLVLAVAVISLLAAALLALLGERGLAVGAALGGLVDAHSSALSLAAMTAAGKLSASEARWPILLALGSNSLAKCGVAWSSGGRGYALRLLPGLLGAQASLWLVALLAA